MAVVIFSLFEPTQLTLSPTPALYVAQLRTQIDKITIANPSATTSYTATVYWVPALGAAASTNAIQTTRALQPLETWDVWTFIGHTIAVGDSIQAIASVANVLTAFGSGRTMTP